MTVVCGFLTYFFDMFRTKRYSKAVNKSDNEDLNKYINNNLNMQHLNSNTENGFLESIKRMYKELFENSNEIVRRRADEDVRIIQDSIETNSFDVISHIKKIFDSIRIINIENDKLSFQFNELKENIVNDVVVSNNFAKNMEDEMANLSNKIEKLSYSLENLSKNLEKQEKTLLFLHEKVENISSDSFLMIKDD